ncbi:MAG: glycosyltransferase family 2 protein [Synergistaceae bacterium]|jgi:dolichol-phosphate mannosyltransferase|nr:glycosyltransferase family 2 protein [Synergistaceae bacterium]
MRKPELISVVSPVYKAAGCVGELYRRIVEAVKSIDATLPYEIIFVEDCGQDGSWEKIRDLALQDPHLKAVQLSRNFGQHPAITAGLALAAGDWVVVMDCDLQDPPEEIPRLYAKALEGYDMVCARRGKRKDPLWKRLTSRLFVAVFNRLSGMSYDPQVANFRILSRLVADTYSRMGESVPSFGGHLEWLGFNVGYIDIRHQPRYSGQSSYSLRKLFKLAANVIVAYSNKPLHISISLGFFMAFFSTLYALYIVAKKYWAGVSVDGWTSLMVSIWFLGGMVVGNLGIIGLYLGKVYDEAKGRPIYVVARAINCEKNNPRNP